MRWLIGLYLTLGAVQLALAALIAGLATRSLFLRGGSADEEALMIAAISLFSGCIPLVAAYGLWKRWRLVRLALLVLGWWNLGVCVFASGMALAIMAGLTDGKLLGVRFDDPPSHTLLIAFGVSAFVIWQYLVLVQPSVTPAPTPAEHREEEPVLSRHPRPDTHFPDHPNLR